MLTEILIEIYSRDIEKLGFEIESYSNEADIWRVDGEITNSAGNLCLHLCGNLQHFIGTVLGGSEYVRDRDSEFSTVGISREKLLTGIESAHRSVVETLTKLDEVSFAKTYPIEVFGKPMTTGFFLVHLATHLDYHLGQINYHRRIFSSK